MLSGQTSPKQIVDVADKAEIRLEAQLPKNRMPVEASSEQKPTLENAKLLNIEFDCCWIVFLTEKEQEE